MKTLAFNTDIARFTEKQLEAVSILRSGLCKFFLYGGALGGGKSYLLRWYCVRYLLDMATKFGLTGVRVMLACEDYPTLKDRQISQIGKEFDMNRIILRHTRETGEKIQKAAPLGKLHADHKEHGASFILSEHYGGGVICFRNLDDPKKYQSAEFALVAIDELTKNTYDTFIDLFTRLRWPEVASINCQFIAGTNPGSKGHGWVKQLWLDRNFPKEWYENDENIDYRPQFHFLRSKAEHNPYIDNSYWSSLSALPENLRKAYKDGNWDVFVGQAFNEWSSSTHVIEPQPIPEWASLYMTFDWGFGKPFSIGWWWVDEDERLYRFNEWYGWTGTSDTGLRMSDPEIAQEVVRKEKQMGIWGKDVQRICDPTCFNKKPDYKGGGQGPSTAEEFAAYELYFSPGDPNRQLKLRQFHNRLTVPKDGTKPMVLVYETCEQFIRTIPDLVVDKNNIEDIDTKGEDHI
jgi:hypothetical protein